MSDIQIIETGEVVSRMTEVEAERITARIADKLDAIADNLEQVLPLISEALTRDAWRSLGYVSPSAYVSERFAGALTRLSPEVRRPVVAQLSAAGMSTRAIAPIVGTSDVQVHRDVKATATSGSSSDSPRVSHGLDGKTRVHQARTAPSVPTAPSAPPAESAISPEEIYDEETGEIISTTPEPERTPEQKQADKDLTLINDIRLYLGHMSRSRQIKNMSPTAKQHIINALEDTISAIKGETS